MENPLRLIITAIVLLIMGVVLPFVMVLGILESTFFLNFLAVTSSTAGLLMGFIGIGLYMRSRR